MDTFADVDVDRVTIYWCGRALCRQFRAVLDGLEMAARAKGEPFEWREQKGWFASSYSVRAVPDRHATIRRWARENATWTASGNTRD